MKVIVYNKSEEEILAIEDAVTAEIVDLKGGDYLRIRTEKAKTYNFSIDIVGYYTQE